MQTRTIVKNALASVLREKDLAWNDKISLEEPKNGAHGDLTTNAALFLAKEAKKSPRILAEEIASSLTRILPLVEKIEVAGPGFCNIFMKSEAWQRIIPEIEKAGKAYGHSDAGAGKKVQVEYVSANPTGPLHVGHGRGAAVGDALARILRAAGYEVETEYYLNDAGRQMRLLGESIWARAQQEAGQPGDFPADGYRGEYVAELARELMAERKDLFELPEEESRATCLEFGIKRILDGIKSDLARFGCEHQRFFSEKSLLDTGAVKKALDTLAENERIHEEDGALWYDSATLGDEQRRVLRKSDGSLTYFATDIAYHHDKYSRGYDWVIDVWGADHHGYIPRMKAAVEDMGHDPESFSVILIQLVNLLENGALVSMSTRAGEFVTLAQLLDEVGVDAARFMFLSRSCDTPLDFDLELARRRSMDNPVYYAQYAHARVASLLRRASERGQTLPETTDVELLSCLTDPEEISLLRLMDDYESIVANAAQNLAPHQIARYVTSLAGRLHGYYSRHNILNQEDRKLVLARLALARAAGQILRNGLFLLGVSAPEVM